MAAPAAVAPRKVLLPIFFWSSCCDIAFSPWLPVSRTPFGHASLRITVRNSPNPAG